jgi:hypothetical protein
MKPRRGTKANPFEVGEAVRMKPGRGDLGVGVVQKVSAEEGPRHDLFENHPVLYLVTFAFSRDPEPTWLTARDLEAAE